MKKITNLLIVASLAMAGAAMAQQPTPPDESQPPSKQHAPDKKPKTEKPAQTHAPKTDAAAPKEPAAAQAPAMTPPATKADKKGPKNQKNITPATAPNADQSTSTSVPSTTPDVRKNQSRRNSKNSKTPGANANTSPSATAAMTPKTKATASPAAAKTTTTPAPTAATTPATTPAPTTAATTPAAGATSTPVTTASASVAPSVTQTNSTNAVNPNAAKKPDQQKVQQIKQQHQSFRAEARPERVPPVTFSAGFRLPGSEHWQGPQYEVYRSYHPERHDRGWYTSHNHRVELIAGGYYYFNNGYWYPAWGYDTGHEYYAYDAPIYVGPHAEPPDKVIADVQTVLQDMGYYKGEVDGLIGPLTREALTSYQRDNGMTVTAVIDEPTLDSLNMSS